MPALTPEQMQEASQAMNFLRQSGVDLGGMFGAPGARDSPGATGSPAPPADTRPPEERYAEQLRQLNDMGFFDFDRNVEALRRSGGSVQGAIEQLLS
jgi:ubiquilin